MREPARCAGISWHSLTDLPAPVPAYEARVLKGLANGNLPTFTHYGF